MFCLIPGSLGAENHDAKLSLKLQLTTLYLLLNMTEFPDLNKELSNKNKIYETRISLYPLKSVSSLYILDQIFGELLRKICVPTFILQHWDLY